MAGRAGVLAPDVLAAGRFGPSRDAALVTSVPDGRALSDAAAADLADGTLDEIPRAALRLRGAGIAHGALGGDTIIVSGRGICVRDFRRASACAPASRLDSDLAAALGAMAVRSGSERTAAAAARVLGTDAARGALVHLQRAALDPVTVAALQHQKDLLPRLREAVASEAGIDLPRLAVFAVRVRFFQRQGYDAAAALSSGAIASTASWIVKGLLFLAAFPFAAGTFQAPSGSGGHRTAVWIILAAGIATALVSLVPRLRRRASRRIRPHLVRIWADVKAIATEPRKVAYVLAGSTLAQLMIVLSLGASLHAVGSGPASRH